MKAVKGAPVSVSTTVNVPIQLAWEALCMALENLEVRPGSTTLQLPIPGAFEARLAVPIKVATSAGNSRYELKIAIEAATRRRLFPVFHGVIWMVHTLAATCDLRLEGWYRVPLSSIGSAIDVTLLRDAASESLKSFIEQLARDITSRVRIVS